MIGQILGSKRKEGIMKLSFALWCLSLSLPFLQVLAQTDSKSGAIKKEQLRAVKLPPCQSCRLLVDSFKKGIERTSRGKFEGGDAAWEEQKQGSYARSEVRLVEIQEKLCSDVERGHDQCLILAEENEHVIEDWWFHKQDESDLHKWLCIEHTRACCPENHYGPLCSPCPGYPDICSKNGKCKGAGTRKGNGQCMCDTGYAGELCNDCSEDHYVAYRDDNKLLCSPCHPACQGACSLAGTKGCVMCKEGWRMDPETGCEDINECYEFKQPCKKNQFCVNSGGSFSCLECDKSCSSCNGDGPDSCEKCAEGYVRKENLCVDEQQLGRKDYVIATRYLTYFGLCIATCIIFQKNVVAASVIGLSVALYISVSEYMEQTGKEAGIGKGLNIASIGGMETAQ